MSALDDEQVRNVCMADPIANRECCAYLACDEEGMICAKTNRPLMAFIKERLALGAMNATGDNCSGPPDFRRNRNFEFPIEG